VNKLRHKLILAFLAATLLPTLALFWMSVALLKHSLSYVATDDLDLLSKSLERVAREYYRQSRDDLKEEAVSGRIVAQRFTPNRFSSGPSSLRQFWESGEKERYELSQPDGDRLNYLVRGSSEVLVYTRSLHGVRMEELTQQIRQAREQIDRLRQRDLQKGFTSTLIFLSAIIWALALASVIFVANRISRPIQDLTAGLHRLAGGDFEARLISRQQDEIGQAVQAFNHTADHLQQSRDRLVYLAQIASWQTLARKMAHELKNSLTPIRLTVEEIVARSPSGDRQFLNQAAQVVIAEVESLERRVRSFSEFAAEPVTNAGPLDLNALLSERIQFLEVAHPDVHYQIAKAGKLPVAWADADQVKGILTNLLENAAEAAGPGGTVCTTTDNDHGRLMIEVHDSGPGLTEDARRSLFEPTISFKQHGMGLGLSISRKNALLAGGDLQVIEGSLGGAGFRLVLPSLNSDIQSGKSEKHGS
jgi:two-component system, NtrC family, nitrogen regulation sensor histidine kinase NtrY